MEIQELYKNMVESQAHRSHSLWHSMWVGDITNITDSNGQVSLLYKILITCNILQNVQTFAKFFDTSNIELGVHIGAFQSHFCSQIWNQRFK